jgi:Methyltransferase domain
MLCRICGSDVRAVFKHRLRGKYDCQYYSCGTCGVLQTEEPYWLSEAYADPIVLADTGVLDRNLILSRIVSLVLFFLFDRRGKFVDVAGGYGIFTRLMRDIGFDFHWSDKYCDNLLARGFEATGKGDGAYSAVTAFEVLEHLADPVAFLADTLETTGADTIIFTTELFDGEPPAQSWWYYGFDTGQHITFYQRSTLEFIGRRFGMQFHSTGPLHVWTRRKINPLTLKVVAQPRIARLLSWLPRRALGSRTWADHEYLRRSE